MVRIAELGVVDPVLSTVYAGGSAGSMADEPLARLLGRSNEGGFRFDSSPAKQDVRFAVLFTTGPEPNWPLRHRHRQFGVFVTTPFFNKQVYEEGRTDAHPINTICERDIADTLRRDGCVDPSAGHAWLEHWFPAA